ncbi:twin-arginine translocation signal domain-containing protein [Halorussus lipolyticus]|uniref:twin-arginine translocation signal domain-containing protein n=1 Tax=Halorussus lipolyticus TaxID=3034024 RepID=UPI0023E81D1E|nr:twin-arginine translocation signal domain-containing protein [Halorussus sp. DT80]
MNRRQFLRLGGAAAASTGAAGCVSEFTGIEVHEFEVWNEDEEGHVFDVSVSVVGEDDAYERSVELGGASGSTFTREVLADAPASSITAAEVSVGDQRARADLTTYDESLATVSLRRSREGELAVAVFF